MLPNEIDAIERFVMEEMSTDKSGHNHQHAFRVVTNAKRLMEREGGDERVVIASSYLHDCMDHKLFDDQEAQKKKIEDLLFSIGYGQPVVEEVLEIVQSISFSNPQSRKLTNLNAQIVCDADRLDAVGAMGIIRTIEYGTSRGRLFYNEKDMAKVDTPEDFDSSTSLAHFYQKLLLLEDLMFTQSAKEMAQGRTQFMKNFLEQFYEEVR